MDVRLYAQSNVWTVNISYLSCKPHVIINMKLNFLKSFSTQLTNNILSYIVIAYCTYICIYVDVVFPQINLYCIINLQNYTKNLK
jgi:hypothetical protein